MRHEGIDKGLRDYYGEYRLRSESADRLKRMIRAGNASALQEKKRNAWLVAAAFAVAVAGTAALTAVFVRQPGVTGQGLASGVSAAIANEAARCHIRDFGPEVGASSYGEVRERMTKLEFVPVEPRRFHGRAMKLVGARYVMLGSQPGVALLLEDSMGMPCTLFEVRPAERLASVGEGRFEIDGLAVDVWREKGLVMVLARASA